MSDSIHIFRQRKIWIPFKRSVRLAANAGIKLQTENPQLRQRQVRWIPFNHPLRLASAPAPTPSSYVANAVLLGGADQLYIDEGVNGDAVGGVFLRKNIALGADL